MLDQTIAALESKELTEERVMQLVGKKVVAVLSRYRGTEGIVGLVAHYQEKGQNCFDILELDGEDTIVRSFRLYPPNTYYKAIDISHGNFNHGVVVELGDNDKPKDLYSF